MATALVHIILISFAFRALVLKRALQTRRKLAVTSDAMIIVRIQEGRIALGAICRIEATDAVIDHTDTFLALFCVANETSTVSAFCALGGRRAFRAILQGSRAKYARFMVIGHMVALIADITIVNSRATHAINYDFLAKFAFFVHIEHELSLAGFAIVDIFTETAMRNEEIAVLASTSTDEIVVLAMGALIRSCAGFAMRQD